MTRSGRFFLAALVAAAALTFLSWHSVLASGSAAGSSYAVLSVDRDASDKEVVASLRKEGLSDIVSESTQWIAINDFGEWENVPLDEFRGRIERFDPRDTGYADQLRSFFVAGKERLLFIKPAFSVFGYAGFDSLSRSVARAMGDRRYALKTGDALFPSPVPFVLTLLSVAAVAFFLKSALVCVSLPVLLAPACFGVGGFVVGGLLCVFFLLSHRAAEEALRSLHFGVLRKRGIPWVLDYVVPGGLISVLMLIVAFLSALSFAVVSIALVSSAAIALAAASGIRYVSQKRAHDRFVPVVLRSDANALVLRCSSVLLPFALAALVFALFSLSFPRAARSPAEPLFADIEQSFSLDAYNAHLDRQRSFLTTCVMDSEAEKGYTLFSVGADGFTHVSDQAMKAFSSVRVELPPAERLLSEAGGGLSRFSVSEKPAVGTARTLAELAIAAVLSVPALRAFGSKRRQSKAAAAEADKRIAA